MAKQIDDAAVFRETVEVLLAHGYAGATTKQIAAAANINEATLFRKYGSKAQLVTAALLHERRALEAVPVAYTGDLAADLLQMVSLYAGASQRQSALVLLIMSEAARHSDLQETMQVPYMLVAKFGRIISRYQMDGRLRAGDPLLIVGALVGPVIVNSLLRAAATTLPVPPIDLAAHVSQFMHGYALK